MSERELFEQHFPLPSGIRWNGRSHGPARECGVAEFVGLCGVAARWDQLWEAWQSRAALALSAVLPEGYLIVERGSWTEEQADSAAKTLARLRDIPGMDDRTMALACADAAQCKAPEITLADLNHSTQPEFIAAYERQKEQQS